MRIRVSFVIFALALLSLPLAAQRGGRGNAAAAPSPPHDPHDLTGIWNLAGGTDLSLSPTPPPLTPEGQRKFDLNKPSYGRELGSADAAAHPEEHISRRRGVPPALGNDPIGDCIRWVGRVCSFSGVPSKSSSFRIVWFSSGSGRMCGAPFGPMAGNCRKIPI